MEKLLSRIITNGYSNNIVTAFPVVVLQIK